jgi:hypothetical protein
MTPDCGQLIFHGARLEQVRESCNHVPEDENAGRNLDASLGDAGRNRRE